MNVRSSPSCSPVSSTVGLSSAAEQSSRRETGSDVHTQLSPVHAEKAWTWSRAAGAWGLCAPRRLWERVPAQPRPLPQAASGLGLCSTPRGNRAFYTRLVPSPEN